MPSSLPSAASRATSSASRSSSSPVASRPAAGAARCSKADAPGRRGRRPEDIPARLRRSQPRRATPAAAAASRSARARRASLLGDRLPGSRSERHTSSPSKPSTGRRGRGRRRPARRRGPARPADGTSTLHPPCVHPRRRSTDRRSVKCDAGRGGTDPVAHPGARRSGSTRGDVCAAWKLPAGRAGHSSRIDVAMARRRRERG